TGEQDSVRGRRGSDGRFPRQGGCRVHPRGTPRIDVVGTPGAGCDKIAAAAPRGQLLVGATTRPTCAGPPPPPPPDRAAEGCGTPAARRCEGAETQAPWRAGTGEARAARALAPRRDPGR